MLFYVIVAKLKDFTLQEIRLFATLEFFGTMGFYIELKSNSKGLPCLDFLYTIILHHLFYVPTMVQLLYFVDRSKDRPCFYRQPVHS